MAKLISSPGILILLPISSPVNVITVCSLNETFPVTSKPASIYSFPFSRLVSWAFIVFPNNRNNKNSILFLNIVNLSNLFASFSKSSFSFLIA